MPPPVYPPHGLQQIRAGQEGGEDRKRGDSGSGTSAIYYVPHSHINSSTNHRCRHQYPTLHP
jgi:hypothetical protein